jgi:serine/threonine-protein kinase
MVLVGVVAVSFFVAARPATIKVPDLREKPVKEAVAELGERDLDRVERQVVDDPAAARGTVLDQEPLPGTRVEHDTVVVLTVASGRGNVSADGLLGDAYAQAARDVVALGLVPMRALVTQDEDAGTVVEVSPTGDLPLGSTVTLTVAVAPAPVQAPVTSPSSSSGPRANGPRGHTDSQGNRHGNRHDTKHKDKNKNKNGTKHGPGGKHGGRHGR